MGFDLAGMGNVAQGASDMRDAQNRQLYNRNVRQQQLQAAENNALKLRELQQAEVNRQVQSKQNADFVDSNAALRQPKRYTETAINPDAANMPVAPVTPVGSIDPAMIQRPVTPTPSIFSAPQRPVTPTPLGLPQRPVTLTPDAPPKILSAGKGVVVVNPQPNPSANMVGAPVPLPTDPVPYSPPHMVSAGKGMALSSRTMQLGAPARPVTPTPMANAPTATTASTALPAAVQQWAPQVTQAAAQYGVDPNIALSLINSESSGNPNARPPVNPKTGKRASTAGGLYQFIDDTAAQYGLTDKFNPSDNINAGVQLLGDNLDKFGGDYAKALAAHHDGATKVAKAVAKYGDNWRRGLNAGTSDYVDKILARGGHPAAYVADSGEPMPTTLVPANGVTTPAAEKVVLDNKKVWNVVASSATPEADALRENARKFYTLRVHSTTDPQEQQGYMDKLDAIDKQSDEADMFHAYMGASNSDPAGIQALAGLYQEATGSQIGMTMQGGQLVAYNKGADGNPQVLFSGAPHDVASKVYASISPAMRAATLATSQAAAKAEVEEAPKRATEIAKALITANATSKDKQLGNITKLQYAQILGNAKVKSALAAYGIKANEVKLYPSTIPGGITLGTKGGNIFTYLPGKTDNGFTTPDSIQPVDMTSFASVSPQLSAADTSAVGADSPADVYPEDQ